MGRCDQGIKFCSILKVLGMRRKQCHCVRLVFLISAVYLLSQTESVWRKYRDLFAKPNRQNFWMLTIPVRTVRTVTWQVDDVAHFYWLMLTSHVLTHVWLLANRMRTRGPIWRRHMSLIIWLLVLCKI
jgi:hypothetical protein